MPQTKIYGYEAFIARERTLISDTLQACMVEALSYPPEKRFQRFIPLSVENFVHPGDRSEKYLVIEISLFEGRAIDTKKQLIRLIFQKLQAALAIDPNDIEIILYEVPRYNWGVRGVPGDELNLNYQVKV
ncbi:tautomerase family protein [filamentous cyanobacterium LEGE 11480]|uniref:Tautomerase family protein n=1 Tax=Romeriopsis navalis LEGE 11480 TaxID=2777977 RepID=A0A928VHX0_9CYAN|nr:tautomerase family protein [Romeriopsis navalis]MBE9028650.1 tautomerase family protein [Romeriopsis navalis LEGE 11480]